MAGGERSRTHPALKGRPILGDELTIEEIIDRHRDQWVVMRVTGRDEDHWPVKGIVLVVARRQQEALDELERLVAVHPETRRKGQPVCSFLAQPDIGPGPEFDALLEELLSSAKPPA